MINLVNSATRGESMRDVILTKDVTLIREDLISTSDRASIHFNMVVGHSVLLLQVFCGLSKCNISRANFLLASFKWNFTG